MIPKLGPLGFLRSLAKILAGRPRVPPTLQDNPLLNTILQRRSVRSFHGTDIPDDVFAAILEAGRVAPSTVNLQTWSFAVFTAAQWRETVARPIPFAANRAVIVMADTYRARQVLDVFPYSPLVEHTVAVMNASLAAMNMNIAAEALGVSSVMLSETGRSGLLDACYLKETLHLPDGVIPLTTIVFGYAKAGRPPMPPKLPAGQVFFEHSYPPPDRKILEDWLAQMVAGYQAGNLGSSFEGQVRVYQGKIGRAEKELHEMVFYREI